MHPPFFFKRIKRDSYNSQKLQQKVSGILYDTIHFNWIVEDDLIISYFDKKIFC